MNKKVMSRKDYALRFGLIIIGMFLLKTFASYNLRGMFTPIITIIMAIIIIVLVVGLLVYYFIIAVQRVRDMGKSPWYLLLLLVPIINIIVSLELLFMKSKSTPGIPSDRGKVV